MKRSCFRMQPWLVKSCPNCVCVCILDPEEESCPKRVPRNNALTGTKECQAQKVEIFWKHLKAGARVAVAAACFRRRAGACRGRGVIGWATVLLASFP